MGLSMKERCTNMAKKKTTIDENKLMFGFKPKSKTTKKKTTKKKVK